MTETGQDEAGWIEVCGRTVAEATEAGLDALNLASTAEAEIEILEEPQRGLLGFGGRGARLRIRPRVDKSGGLRDLVRDILDSMGLDADISISHSAEGYLNVDLSGPGLGVIIGRRGETLDALQYLLNLAAARMPGAPERVILDAGGYRVRRRATLERLARSIAASVRSSGQEVTLEPMTPQERKIIHLTVAGEAGVRSESRGEDPFRRVVIAPDDGRPRAGQSRSEAGLGRVDAGPGPERDPESDR